MDFNSFLKIANTILNIIQFIIEKLPDVVTQEVN